MSLQFNDLIFTVPKIQWILLFLWWVMVLYRATLCIFMMSLTDYSSAFAVLVCSFSLFCEFLMLIKLVSVVHQSLKMCLMWEFGLPGMRNMTLIIKDSCLLCSWAIENETYETTNFFSCIFWKTASHEKQRRQIPRIKTGVHLSGSRYHAKFMVRVIGKISMTVKGNV